METSIIGWWFTIEPYVYIGLTSECVLLYNTLDGEYIESNKVEIIQLLKKLPSNPQLSSSASFLRLNVLSSLN